MELGELDLDSIEKACDNPTSRYILFEQIVLLTEEIIKTKNVKGLGVISKPMKSGEGKKQGRRPNV